MTILKYLGQSCFLIKTKGISLLTDPMLSFNPLAKDINKNELKPSYILLSHGHVDHTAEAEEIGKANDSLVISNYEVVDFFVQKGLKGHHMNTGGKYMFDFGTLKYVAAVHSSSMPDGSYGGNPGGFVIWNEDVSFYFAGDTALTLDMKLIPMTCPSLDFAILPIGDNFTMGYEDAILASEFINCKTIVGCHYDTFPVIEIDKRKAIKAFKEAGKTLILPEINKEFSI